MKGPGEIFLVAGDPGSRKRGKDPLLAGILARIGIERPSVGYIGAASSDNRLFFLWIAALLKKAGAGPVRLASLAARRADTARTRSLLESSDVIFVSGGDVELGMRVLERAGMIEPLAALRRGGKPFIGLSAGSIMLCRSWVRWTDPDDDSTAAVYPCLDLAPLLCDTHAEKEGWEELKALLKLAAPAVGYGIPAGGALRVGADGSLTALGREIHCLSMDRDGLKRLADLPVS